MFLKRNWLNDIFNIFIKVEELRLNMLIIYLSLSFKLVDFIDILFYFLFLDFNGIQDLFGWSWFLFVIFVRIYGIISFVLGIFLGL